VVPRALDARGVADSQKVRPWGGVLLVPLSLQLQQLESDLIVVIAITFKDYRCIEKEFKDANWLCAK
jgi:hypothetical protein